MRNTFVSLLNNPQGPEDWKELEGPCCRKVEEVERKEELSNLGEIYLFDLLL